MHSRTITDKSSTQIFKSVRDVSSSSGTPLTRLPWSATSFPDEPALSTLDLSSKRKYSDRTAARRIVSSSSSAPIPVIAEDTRHKSLSVTREACPSCPYTSSRRNQIDATVDINTNRESLGGLDKGKEMEMAGKNAIKKDVLKLRMVLTNIMKLKLFSMEEYQAPFLKKHMHTHILKLIY